MLKKSLNLVKLLIVVLLAFLTFMIPKRVVIAQEPLTISDVGVEVFDKSVAISWTTNKSSKGVIEYGKTQDYGTRYGELETKSLFHTITLLNLQSETKYHFKIVAKTQNEEASTYDRTFTTKKFSDNKTPIITKVTTLFVTGRTATIQWETDEEADSQIYYGKSTSYGSKRASSEKTTTHDLTLTGLSPATVYHYQVKSQDSDRNIAVYYDSTFRTNDTDLADKQELQITNIRPISLNDENVKQNSAVISWYTNHPADGTVRYGKTTQLGKTLQLTPPRDFFHSVTLSQLESGTKYFFKVTSKDVFGKSGSLEVLSFVTLGGSPLSALENNQNGVVLSESFSEDQEASLGDFLDNVVFYASFDQCVNADYAKGNITAEIRDKTARVITDGPLGKIKGALDLSLAGFVAYERSDNFYLPRGTIAFWIKPQWQDSEKNKILFELGPDYSKTILKSFQIIESGDRSTLHFKLNDDRGRKFDFYQDGLRQTQKLWHFITVSWSFNGGFPKLYYDGVLVDPKGKSIGKTLFAPPTFGKKFYLSNYRSPIAALIDEFIIFDRALTDSEVHDIYVNGVNQYFQKEGSQDDICNRKAVIKRSGTGTPGGRVLGVATSDEQGSLVGIGPYTKAQALYRVRGTPDIYALLNGKKHYISGPSSFRIYGYRWEDVKEVSQEFLDRIPYAHLIKTPFSPAVYYVYPRPQRKHLKLSIPSPTVFVSYQNNYWGNIVVVNELDINAFPNAQFIKTSEAKNIYFLSQNIKRPFVSIDEFTRIGLNPYEIVEINDIQLNSYKQGEEITSENFKQFLVTFNIKD